MTKVGAAFFVLLVGDDFPMLVSGDGSFLFEGGFLLSLFAMIGHGSQFTPIAKL